MMGIFCAEWLKTKGGALRPLVFLLSPLVGAVLAWYVVGRPWIAAGSAFSRIFLGLGGAGDAACAGDCGGAAGA